MEDVRKQLCEVRNKLKAQTRGIIMQYERSKVVINSSSDFQSLAPAVKQILCALDTDEVGVMNVVFEKGGVIPAHSHDRVEHIYVINGSIKDNCNGKTFKQGEVYRIPSEQTHEIASDFAMLVVTWTPAYGKVNVQ